MFLLNIYKHHNNNKNNIRHNYINHTQKTKHAHNQINRLKQQHIKHNNKYKIIHDIDQTQNMQQHHNQKQQNKPTSTQNINKSHKTQYILYIYNNNTITQTTTQQTINEHRQNPKHVNT